MRVLIVGAGGAMAVPIVAAFHEARLKGASVDLALFARPGATFDALKSRGVSVRYAPQDSAGRLYRDRDQFDVPPSAYRLGSRPEDFDHAFEIIIVALKATEFTLALATSLAPMMTAETLIIPIQNGVPFWLPATAEAKAHKIKTIERVDPDGALLAAIGRNVVGGFTAAAARSQTESVDGAMVAIAGTSLVTGDFKYDFGALHDHHEPRVAQLVTLLQSGGLKIEQSRNILKEAWIKLLGNAVFNQMAVVHDASLQEIAAPEGPLRAKALQMMAEVKAVGEKLGVAGAERFDLEKRIDAVSRMTHKTSTHADFSAGKAPEIDFLLGGLVELGEKLGVAIPHLSALYAEVHGRAVEAGIYRPMRR